MKNKFRVKLYEHSKAVPSLHSELVFNQLRVGKDNQKALYQVLEIIEETYVDPEGFQLYPEEFFRRNLIESSTPILNYAIKHNCSKFVMDIITKYEKLFKELININPHTSFLHELAKVGRKFNEDDINLFNFGKKNTFHAILNPLNKTCLELALCQNSPNLVYFVNEFGSRNRKNEWIVIKVLTEKLKIRNSNIQNILKYYKFGGMVKPYYMKLVENLHHDEEFNNQLKKLKQGNFQ